MEIRKWQGKVLPLLMSVALIAGTLPLSTYADEKTATSMKLTSTEGNVTISNGIGRKMSPFKGMNLSNGYHVLTDTNSTAMINMDDTKLATVGELSDVDISKQGEDLELRLNAGDVFVSVNKKIAKTATVKVRTANVVMGITGTDVLAILDPETGEVRVGGTKGTGNIAITNRANGRKAIFTWRAGRMFDVNMGALDGGNGDIKDAVTERPFAQTDVTLGLANTVEQRPEVMENADESVKNIDLTDPSKAQEKLGGSFEHAVEPITGSGVTDGTGSGSGVSTAFTEAEEEANQADAKATAEAEKKRHRHHHDEDDDDKTIEPCAVHTWGEHNLGINRWTDNGTEYQYDPEYGSNHKFTITVECTVCHTTAVHEVWYEIPNSAQYTSVHDDTYTWHCVECNLDGNDSF